MNWWQQGVFYQIYPRSFQDSNGDGVGDLQGLIQRLDYLNDGTEQSLGIDAIWLSPFFPSPMRDFGYDISDYCAIDPQFGSMDDFDELLQQAHQRQIRIILDLVVNHTSDQHPWFQQSCDPDSDKADWYIWHKGKQPPNNWLGCFGGRGWAFNAQRQAWYYHSFLPQQPDLNWRNPAVKQAVKQVMEFWLAKGVDGFRLDVVNLYYKDAQLRNNPTDWFRLARPYDRQRHIYDRDQPEMHSLLHEMRHWIDAWPERMMVGEVMLADAGNSDLPASYYGQNDELHLAFNFEFLRAPFKASAFHAIIRKWTELLGGENWPNYTLSNHDFCRHASRYRAGKLTQTRLEILAALLLTLRGTPFLYYGEETGMPEQNVKRRDLQDPVGIRYWPLHPGRDGCRRPMMWDAPLNTFTQGQSWLPDEPVPAHSVTQQQQDPHSLLSWYKKLIWLRKKTPALHQGKLRLLQASADVLAYERSGINAGRTERLLILLNFSNRTQSTSLHPQALAACLLNNKKKDERETSAESLDFHHGRLQLQPLQALVLQLQDDYPLKVYV
jgi:alpha-glucosidase